MPEHIVTLKVNAAILGALIVLAFATLGISYIDLGRWNLVLAMVIAVIKALLVVAFFMHAWFEPRLMRLAFGAGFFWLGILVVLTMSDYLTRGWVTGGRSPYHVGSYPTGSK